MAMAMAMGTAMGTGTGTGMGMGMGMVTGMVTATAMVMATGITKTKDPSDKKPGGSDCCHRQFKINIE